MQALDLVGPMEVFAGAAQAVPGAYEVRVAAPGGGLGTSSGLTILAPSAVPDPAGIDTLLVCGGPGVSAASRDERLIGWLRERLTPYQVPVDIVAVDELPRTPSLKVSQPGLRELLERLQQARETG